MPLYSVKLQKPGKPDCYTNIRVDRTSDSRYPDGGFYATNLALFGCGKTKGTEYAAIRELVEPHGWTLIWIELAPSEH